MPCRSQYQLGFGVLARTSHHTASQHKIFLEKLTSMIYTLSWNNVSGYYGKPMVAGFTHSGFFVSKFYYERYLMHSEPLSSNKMYTVFSLARLFERQSNIHGTFIDSRCNNLARINTCMFVRVYCGISKLSSTQH